MSDRSPLPPLRSLAPLTIALSAAIGGLGALGCDRPPSVELKEWTPSDHEGEKKGASANARQGAKGESNGPGALADITWRSQCATCHGAGGHGDGPQGPMFKAADLARPEWQASVTDEQIATAILQGKGRMPKFELSEDVVRGLVARVRSFRGQ